MKYILSFVGICLVCCGLFFCKETKNYNQTFANNDYMRIHITANSNSDRDQNMKYKVKDAVVDFLIPKLAYAENREQAEQIIFENLEGIKDVVKDLLQAENANYGAKFSIEPEKIPTRAYDNLVLNEGIYQCLKIDLGDANGDNWWCVVFPAVCFLSSKNSGNYVYISKIWDIICSVTR